MSDLTNIHHELRRELESGGRSAIRYPVRLPVRILCNKQEYTAETENFSSSGALLCMSSPLPEGANLQFLIEIPAGVIGSNITAAIQGEGQVIRTYQENSRDKSQDHSRNYAAIVIHEYRFQ